MEYRESEDREKHNFKSIGGQEKPGRKKGYREEWTEMLVVLDTRGRSVLVTLVGIGAVRVVVALNLG